MRLLGFAVLLLAWAVILIGGCLAFVEWRRDSLLKQWWSETRFIPVLEFHGTFRKARR